MTKMSELYKCDICLNIVEITHAGNGVLECCNQAMNLLGENNIEASFEKHIPVFSCCGDEITVKVGETHHPMEEKHYIEFIELVSNNKVFRKILTPTDKPEVKFHLDNENDEFYIRSYCNLHGLWRNN